MQIDLVTREDVEEIKKRLERIEFTLQRLAKKVSNGCLLKKPLKL